MKTYLINLPERTDRLEQAKRQLEAKNIAFTVVPAMRSASGISHDGLRMTITRLLEEAPPGDLCIFEDDVVLCNDFEERYSKLKIPGGWQMLYLGGMTRIADDLKTVSACEVEPGIWRTIETVMSEAVIIAAGARGRVLETIRKNRHDPIDIALIELQKEGNVYCCIPRLCWQRRSVSDRTGKEEPESSHFFVIKERQCETEPLPLST